MFGVPPRQGRNLSTMAAVSNASFRYGLAGANGHSHTFIRPYSRRCDAALFAWKYPARRLRESRMNLRPQCLCTIPENIHNSCRNSEVGCSCKVGRGDYIFRGSLLYTSSLAKHWLSRTRRFPRPRSGR